MSTSTSRRSSLPFMITTVEINEPKQFFQKRNLLNIFLFLIILILLLTTFVFLILWLQNGSHLSKAKRFARHNGIIGFPPLLPNDGNYIEFNILQLNDVYEMLPLDGGKKGGLARVARVRQLLLEENASTFTILSGDFLSPSALSQSLVNGSRLDGRQMISTLNTLGLDFVTFGNHEFDLKKRDLISNMLNSKFSWISSNVFQPSTNKTFSSSMKYKLVHLHSISILFIGLTIEDNKPYVDIVNKTSLIPYVQQFIKSLSHLQYDVLIALTHLEIATDIRLAEKIPEIDLILGGHEHEDYHLLRGQNWTPICKADGNAFTVFIHRCALNLNTRVFRVYSTLTPITPQIEDEVKTKEVIDYWYNLGIKGFEEMGFEPNETVCCLPKDVELDGLTSSIRYGPTLLTEYCCESLIQSSGINGSVVSLFNTGSIRIEDILRGKISQYDILRVIPFSNNIISLLVPGEIILNLLLDNNGLKGNGMFLSYRGIETNDQGKSWFINGNDISQSQFPYNVITTKYAQEHTRLNHSSVILLKEYQITQAKSLMDYLKTIYPSC